MEKTLQQQYTLIKEGKGNKDHFLKSARRVFPEFITPNTDYNTAVHILKGKSILSEGVGGIATLNPIKPDWFKIFDTNLKEAIKEETYALSNQEIKEKSPITNMSIIDMYNLLSYIDDIDFIQEIGIIISRKDWNNRGEFAAKQKIYREIQKRIDDQNIVNDLEEEIYRLITASSKELNEAIGVKNTKEYGDQNEFEKIDTETQKTLDNANFDYKDDKNIDNVYGQSFLMGYYTEMKDPKNEGKTVDELKAIVLKNMVKDVNYYHTETSFGVKGIGYTKDVVGGGDAVAPKGKYKSSGYGDMPKAKVVKEGIDKTISSKVESLADKVVKWYEKHPNPKMKERINSVEKTLENLMSKTIGKDAISYSDFEKLIKNKFNLPFEDPQYSKFKQSSLNEAKKPNVHSRIKDLEKQNEVLALESKITALEEAINELTQKVSLSESDDLAEMMDPKKINELKKDIKVLEKYKMTCEKKLSKLGGKKTVVDNENMDENMDMDENAMNEY